MKATPVEVQRAASGYVFRELGDRLYAGDPVFDEQRQRWSVPIRALELSGGVCVGHVLLDAEAAVIEAPSRSALQRAIERESAAAEEMGGPVDLAWAVRSLGGLPAAAAEESELPADPREIGEEILADDDRLRAYKFLRAALRDPKMRPAVIQALEAFAKVARKQDSD